MMPHSTLICRNSSAGWFSCRMRLVGEGALSCDNLWHSEKDALEVEPLSGKFVVSEGFPTLSPCLLVWFTVEFVPSLLLGRLELNVWLFTGPQNCLYDNNFNNKLQIFVVTVSGCLAILWYLSPHYIHHWIYKCVVTFSVKRVKLSYIN